MYYLVQEGDKEYEEEEIEPHRRRTFLGWNEKESRTKMDKWLRTHLSVEERLTHANELVRRNGIEEMLTHSHPQVREIGKLFHAPSGQSKHS